VDRGQPLRVGIIGGGWIARRHVPAIDSAEGVALVAACDADEPRAAAIAEPRGARAYAQWEEMLEREALDAVWVCTPPLLHRGPAVAALERGINVYLEKPIARTLEDGEAITGAAAGSDAVCAVGYQWHASELLDEVRDVLGGAGQSVGMMIGRNLGPTAARPWFMDRAQGGGQILERGSHHIDLQRAIAGEVVAAEASGGSVRLAQPAQTSTPGDIEDVLVLLLHFANGALGCVNMAWTRDGQPGRFTLDVLASDASIWLDLGGGRYRMSGVGGGRELHADYGDPLGRSIGRFLEGARSGDRNRVFCTPADALRTLAVVLACERALAEGGRVSV
jgi:myo-inositol 2-dehydrogenase/D-chiro-inositol 1-dehydrogenase